MSRMLSWILLLTAVLWIWPARGREMELRLRGRLQTRFEAEERPREDSWVSRFRLKRARVDGRWKPVDWIRLVLELEGAGRLDLYDSGVDGWSRDRRASVELKDAYGRFDLGDKAFRFQVGQFKKPFSRLKMESSWDLWLPVRGLLNRYAVNHTRHSGYGGRDVGIMVSGRFRELARLRYYLGMFSGPRYLHRVENSSTDYLARFQFRPFKGLRVACNLSHKVYHYKEGALRPGVVLTRGAAYTGNLWGADARYRLGDLTVLVEGALGDNPDFGPGHTLYGLHGTLAYSLEPLRDLVITPAVMLEWFDPSDAEGLDGTLRAAGALNIDIEEIIRVILFFELTTGEITVWDRDAAEGGAYVTQRPPSRVLIQLNMTF